MIRALYTAATGMNAQQANIDNIANNLANVNTTGFKKSRLEFEDLVYQQTQLPGTPTSTANQAPVGLEMGLGTKSAASARDFTAGNLTSTGNPLDVAIEGSGFFQVQMPDGTIAYTRAGNLHLSGQGQLVTTEGYQILPATSIPANATSVSISKDGIVSVALPGQAAAQQIGTIELATFQNPAGLNAIGGNLYQSTTASGDPTTGVPSVNGVGSLDQGFLEDSNVSVVEEMVNMIMGQRAYEANSRVVKAADEMLQEVNNLPQ
ncbi:MAG TPA: flagellar basal-body rod protein FlgG [Vicinamibacterales bacterium]|jgi:flagellar basal-body rod protein FlgG